MLASLKIENTLTTIISIAITFLEFVHTERGQTCSDKGLNGLSKYQDCYVAVTYASSFNPKAHYGGWGDWGNRAKGCYIGDDGRMYFNNHSAGQPLPNIRTICKTGDH